MRDLDLDLDHNSLMPLPFRSLLKSPPATSKSDVNSTGSTTAGKKSKRQSIAKGLRSIRDTFGKVGTSVATVSRSQSAPPPETSGDEQDPGLCPPAENLPVRSGRKQRFSAKSRRTVSSVLEAAGGSRLAEGLQRRRGEIASETEVLSPQSLHALFSGAPHFALKRNEEADVLEPVVTFPFDQEDDGDRWRRLQELSDSRAWMEDAFQLATSRNEEEKDLVHEVPAMTSFLGNEPGTCGWETFITLPVADCEKEEDDEDRESDGVHDGRERGETLSGVKGGIRSVDVAYVVERLKDLGEIWWRRKRRSGEGAENAPTTPTTMEMYTYLFTYVLYPPTKITTADYNDPYSIRVQIMALIEVLAQKNLWLDLCDVGWRIKIGQILWDDASEDDDPAGPPRETEKVWLLLQILLACELAFRLDMIYSQEMPAVERATLLRRFRLAGGKKVDWDILLARRWIENVKIVSKEELEKEAAPPPEPEEASSFLSPTRAWFGSISKPSRESSNSTTATSSAATSEKAEVFDMVLLPRHRSRQLTSLLQFATTLKWPNADSLAQRLLHPTNASSVSGTPSLPTSLLSTPVSISTASNGNSNSYFPPTAARPKRLAEISRQRSTLSINMLASEASSTTGAGGWLSRTYLTGLILPGEGLSHLAISTLLEVDPAAVEKLGFEANLYGGFQFDGKTYWSTYCIIGRVLAGYADARESAGWVGSALKSGVALERCDAGSAEVVEERLDELVEIGTIPDGWIEVVSQPASYKNARAFSPAEVAKNSDVRGRRWKKQMESMSADLNMPNDDDESSSSASVEIKGLALLPPASDGESISELGLPMYEASIYYTLTQAGTTPPEARAQTGFWPLKHDVSFISAYPCLLSPATNASGHPLHKSYSYQTVTIEQLVEFKSPAAETAQIVVVKTSDEAEMVFAKAWCASRGGSAVVARKGATCWGCAVREAAACGVDVVIRVH